MDLFFQTFIDPAKWDAARWKATAFFHDPDGVRPPCLGILFDNIEVGKQIFSDWLNRLGDVDRYEELRISIVEGDILGMGPGYSIHLAPNPLHTADRARALGTALSIETTAIIGRINRMTPEPGSPHLPRFKKEFAKHKRYFLLPVSAQVEPDFEFAVAKTEILFRNASEISKDDLDAVVFPEHYFDSDGTIH